MTTEGISNENEQKSRQVNPEKKFIAQELRESREAAMSRLAEQYKAIQMQIIGLERDLQKGIEYTARQSNPQLDEFGIQLRNETKKKIEDLQIEKETVEQAIRDKGVDPSQYTVQ